MDRKTIIAIIGIALILAAIPLTIYLGRRRQRLITEAAPTTVLSVSPAEVAKEVGETFTIDIQINTGENQVVGADLKMAFDPSVLECLSLSPGDFLDSPADPPLPQSFDNQTGKIIYSIASFVPKQGTNVFVSIGFRAKSAGVSPLTFEAGTSVAGIGENEALQNAVDGRVTVSGGGLRLGLLKVWFQQQNKALDPGRGHKGGVILALKQGGNVVLEKAVELNEDGEARDVELPGIEPRTTYDAYIYEPGYLTKKLDSVELVEGSELDFTRGGTEYFLVGDLDGNQEVNILDFSIFVESFSKVGEE